MKKDKNKQLQKAGEKKTSIIRSSAAEYLTFVAASGQGGVEAVYADETSACGAFSSGLSTSIHHGIISFCMLS
jgi:hypothetical protein